MLPLLGEPLRIGDGEVVLYLADPAEADAPDLRAAYDAALTPEERIRLARFHFDRDRQLFRVAHALLRITLARAFGGRPEAFAFTTGVYGKPAAVGEAAALRFNLSHTRGQVALALTPSREVGVDVEEIRTEAVTPAMIARCYRPAEQRCIEREGPERFFDLWALKEAYLKARGAGLSMSLQGFQFTIDGARLLLEVDAALDAAPHRWQAAVMAPTREHRAAVVAEGPMAIRAFRTLPGVREAAFAPAWIAQTW